MVKQRPFADEKEIGKEIDTLAMVNDALKN